MEIFPVGNKRISPIMFLYKINMDKHMINTCCLQVYLIMDLAITTVDSIGQGCSIAPVVDNNVCY